MLSVVRATVLLVLVGCATVSTAPEPLVAQVPAAGEKVVQSATGTLSAIFPDKGWQIVERLPFAMKLEPGDRPISLAASADFLGPEDDATPLVDLLKAELARELTSKIQWRVTEQGESLLGGRPAMRLQAQAMVGQTPVLLVIEGRRIGQRLCALQLTGMPALLGMGLPIFERAADTFRCAPPADDVPRAKATVAQLTAEAERSTEALDPSRAVALLSRAAQQGSADAALIEKLVQAALVSGDAARAENVLKGELTRHPERFDHWRLLAQIQYQLGDSDAGLMTLKTGAARPGAPAALYAALGEGYLRAEAYGEAEAAFQEAIAKDPKDSAPYAALGEVYFHEKKLDVAERQIQKAISLDPGRAEYHVALSEVYGEGKQDEKAVQECIAALERGVNKTLEATLKYNLACFNARLGRERECLFWLRQAFEAGFNDVEFMRKDPDLATVRDLPAFQDLFQQR
jgi:tetratricopeptide (TPR) repeat protein